MRLNGPSNQAKKLNSGNFEPQDWEIGKIPLLINVGMHRGPRSMLRRMRPFSGTAQGS